MITVRETQNLYKVSYKVNGERIGRLTVAKDPSKLTITGWYVDTEYQHKGIGKQMLKELFAKIPADTIKQIDYIWNGANAYVGKWLEKFDAASHCPLSVLKTLDADSWDSHIYTLDKEKFLAYVNKA